MTVDNHAYRKLDAWQRAMDSYDAVHDLSRTFPPDERFGLTGQIRRAALSVPSNVAEGYGRRHRREYLHHLYIARGSLMETETQLIAAVRRKMGPREQATPVWDILQQTGRLLHGLIASLETDANHSDP
ncbi:MAG: four helix bundle protein [Phycisphaeraceae bacterium]